MDVDVAELLEDDVEVDRPGVVHVEHCCLAVGDDEAGVADRAVSGRAQRDDHDVEVALGTADRGLDRVGCLDELGEPELLELALEVGDRVVGE